MQNDNIHIVPPCVEFEPEAAETMPEAVEYKPPRMRTLKAAIAELKKVDAETQFTERALRRLVVSGAFPAVCVGNKYLVNVDNLFKFLAAGTYAAPPRETVKNTPKSEVMPDLKPAPGIRPVAV